MKILFIGCVRSSYILLNELINSKVDVCGVITKKESKYNSDFYDLTPLCVSNHIEYIYSENTKEISTIEFIKNKKPDLIYCFGWSYLLGKEIIDLAKLGVVGFHPAMLPMNKGRHPLIWALALGLESTGSTFFMIDEKADNGDIISQVEVPIEISDDAQILYDKIMQVAKKQVIQITKAFFEGSQVYVKQSRDKSNVWRKRSKVDGKIDFRMSSLGIYNLVRALTKPYVGAHFEFKGYEYKVWSVEILNCNEDDYKNLEPGKVINVSNSQIITVKTGDGIINLLEFDEINVQEGDYLL